MVKFKVVFGGGGKHADEILNDWLSKHPNVEVVSYQYEQARYGDHSICIMYKEKEN